MAIGRDGEVFEGRRRPGSGNEDQRGKDEDEWQQVGTGDDEQRLATTSDARDRYMMSIGRETVVTSRHQPLPAGVT